MMSSSDERRSPYRCERMIYLHMNKMSFQDRVLCFGLFNASLGARKSGPTDVRRLTRSSTCFRKESNAAQVDHDGGGHRYRAVVYKRASDSTRDHTDSAA